MENMSVERRIRSIRLIEKLIKDKKLSKTMGVDIKFVQNTPSVQIKREEDS